MPCRASDNPFAAAPQEWVVALVLLHLKKALETLQSAGGFLLKEGKSDVITWLQVPDPGEISQSGGQILAQGTGLFTSTHI